MPVVTTHSIVPALRKLEGTLDPNQTPGLNNHSPRPSYLITRTTSPTQHSKQTLTSLSPRILFHLNARSCLVVPTRSGLIDSGY